MRSTTRCARNACRGSASWSTASKALQARTQARTFLANPALVGTAYPAGPSSGAGQTSQLHRHLSTLTAFSSSFQPVGAFRLEQQHATARSAWSLLPSPYSTRHPAGPLPGSNNELDPRGVDYSLFEEEERVARPEKQRRARSRIRDKRVGTERSGTANIRLSTSELTPGAALLRRLIRDDEFHSASQVLAELETLETPLDQHIPEYADAAFWSLRNGRKNEALQWLAISPSFHLAQGANARIKPYFRKQNQRLTRTFRKIFALLLDTAGDDIEVLQKASLLAAKKGHWDVVHTTLAHILRYSLDIPSTSAQGSRSRHAWTYFQGLIKVADERGGAAQRHNSAESLRTRTALRDIYQLSVRTLALSGRLDDAMFWVRTPRESLTADDPQLDLVQLGAFTYILLMEELLKAGSRHQGAASELEVLVKPNTMWGLRYQLPTVESVRQKLSVQAKLRAEILDPARRDGEQEDCPSDKLLSERRLAELVMAGELVEARDYLLSALRSPTSNEPRADGDNARRRLYLRLPSAAALADFQQAVTDLGSVPIISSLTETEGASSNDVTTTGIVSADDFLRPVVRALYERRSGTGLWETAKLLGLVRSGRWKEALRYFGGPSGFRTPAGGITDELIAVATDGSVDTAAERARMDKVPSIRPWPSTHAIALAIRALAGACIEAGDYDRLEKVYRTWKANSLPPRLSTTASASAPLEDAASTASTEKPKRELPDLFSIQPHVVTSLHFTHWPPGHRPDSYTFDPFLKAFAQQVVMRPNPTSSVGDAQRQNEEGVRLERKRWGSGQRALAVLNDMTTDFGVELSVASWTIVLASMARDGPKRWKEPTETLANSMGIRTRSVEAEERRTKDDDDTVAARTLAGLPEATMETYTALLCALLESDIVPHMLEQAVNVRDDLLSRIKVSDDVEESRRTLVAAAVEEGGDNGDVAFLVGLDGIIRKEQRDDDTRKKWTLRQLLDSGRTMHALREVDHHVEQAEQH